MRSTEVDSSKPTTGERLRAIIGDIRPHIEKSISQARTFESPLTDEQITEKVLTDIARLNPAEIVINDWEFEQEEIGEAIEPFVNVAAHLYSHVREKLGTTYEDYQELREALSNDNGEGETLSNWIQFCGQTEPLSIEVVDWGEEVRKDELYDSDLSSFAYRAYGENLEYDIEENKLDHDVVIHSRQVRYIYPTELPGVQLVFQFPQHSLDAAKPYMRYEKKERDGEEYDVPHDLTGLHSIRLIISPEAYRESLKN